MVIEHIGLAVAGGTTYGDAAAIIACRHLPERGVDGKLCRTVGVEETTRLIGGQLIQALTSQCDISEGQMGTGIHQQFSEGGSIVATRDMMVNNILTDGSDIFS